MVTGEPGRLGQREEERREGERLVPGYGIYVSGYETSAYGIEWMRFEPDAAVCAKGVAAGTIDSRKGNATVAPMPCRTVRRERCLFVMNICLLII